MALPTAYLTSIKNLPGIMNAITTAQAPSQFTQKFLENLGFKSNADRLIINVLKALGFIDAGGVPTDRYFRYLDQTQSAKVLAEGIRDAYNDLFAINVNANKMTRAEIKNKLKTLTQGKYGESVLDKMAMTFTALSNLADFSEEPAPENVSPPGEEDAKVGSAAGVDDRHEAPDAAVSEPGSRPPLRLGGLVYNIELVLPESRDQAVYDALFRSLRQHLLG